MHDIITPRTLWAMEEAHFMALMSQIQFDGMVPQSLRGLANLMNGQSAASSAPSAPDREGAVAVLPITGPLSPSGSWSGTSTKWIDEMTRTLAADQKISAIVLNIYSPGGLVFNTQEAGDAIFEARQSKPVIAVANPYSYSAAHWLATQASAFYVSSSGEVGSVGVRGGHVDMSGFQEKIGMKTTLIASSPEKIAGHPYAPLSDEDRATMQTEIDAMNETFKAAIARGRGMKAADVPAMHGSGRTFSSSAALAAGVVDGVMTLREVIAKYSSSRSRLNLMRRRAELQASIADI